MRRAATKHPARLLMACALAMLAPLAAAASISTPFDTIPDYGSGSPNIVSVASGPWSTPATWSTQRVPEAGDVVAIAAGTTVSYDASSSSAIATVAVLSGGQLDFRTDISTRLTVVNLLVYAGGELSIGTAATPVAPAVTAEIVFPDVALDAATDPLQYGNGLIVLGAMTVHGAPLSDTFVRLAAEPQAGDTTLALSVAVAGWMIGDRLLLPDSRHLDWNQFGSNYVAQWETPTIAAVSGDGLTITLSSPLQFGHPGAYDGDGTLCRLPHVGDLSRNVMIHSANPSGTRGHCTFTYRARVDIEDAFFGGLGRTTADPSSRQGRYPVYFDHLYGPAAAPADGYQYTFTGNVVTCPLDPMPYIWGVAIEDSHYGLVQDNILYNWTGAGLVTVDGSETGNVIDHNFVVRIGGNGQRIDTTGTAGTAFWFRGPNNHVRNNVACDMFTGQPYQYGFNYFSYYLGDITVPAFQGADKSAGQSAVLDGNGIPLLECANNEVYGATGNGLTLWWLGTYYQTPHGNAGTISDLCIWHCHGWGVFLYESNNLTIDGLLERGDTHLSGTLATGLWAADYMQTGLVIQNSDIQGMQLGIDTPCCANGPVTVQDCIFSNQTDLQVQTMSSSNGDAGLPEKSQIFRYNTHIPLPGLSHVAINMNFVSGTNTSQDDQTFVYGFNGVSADNFQVFYLQQQDQVFCGEEAPSSAVTRAGIDGLVSPIVASGTAGTGAGTSSGSGSTGGGSSGDNSGTSTGGSAAGSTAAGNGAAASGGGGCGLGGGLGLLGMAWIAVGRRSARRQRQAAKPVQR